MRKSLSTEAGPCRNGEIQARGSALSHECEQLWGGATTRAWESGTKLWQSLGLVCFYLYIVFAFYFSSIWLRWVLAVTDRTFGLCCSMWDLVPPPRAAPGPCIARVASSPPGSNEGPVLELHPVLAAYSWKLLFFFLKSKLYTVTIYGTFFLNK